jgi:hypothetical protein
MPAHVRPDRSQDRGRRPVAMDHRRRRCAPRLHTSATDAIQAAHDAQPSRLPSIEVGCMPINLAYHRSCICHARGGVRSGSPIHVRSGVGQVSPVAAFACQRVVVQSPVLLARFRQHGEHSGHLRVVPFDGIAIAAWPVANAHFAITDYDSQRPGSLRRMPQLRLAALRRCGSRGISGGITTTSHPGEVPATGVAVGGPFMSHYRGLHYPTRWVWRGLDSNQRSHYSSGFTVRPL